ncbi:MAG: hypothetical protein ACTJFI_01050 [Enterococcus viikkiensis]
MNISTGSEISLPASLSHILIGQRVPVEGKTIRLFFCGGVVVFIGSRPYVMIL